MLRKARILLALCALSTLCAAPALYADDAPAGNPPPATGDPIEEILEWLGILDSGDQDPQDDEFNPQHLPGG